MENPAERLSIQRKLGLRIAVIRESRGIRQDDLAYAVGMSRPYLGQIEAGTKNPTIGMVERIADGLGITVAELFDDEVFRWPGPRSGRIAHGAPLAKSLSALSLLEAPDPAEAVLAQLRVNPSTTMPEVAEATGLSRSKVQRTIDRLRGEGRVRREGSRKAGRWVVVDAGGE